jgi:hypothetical protein
LEHSDVDASYFDNTMLVKECASELPNAKARFKYVLAEALLNSDLYGVEVATARVERRYPHLIEDNILQAQEHEERIEKEVKQRKTRWSTQKSLRKLGYKIRGHVKPNSTKKSSLNRLDVQTEDGLWSQIVGKVQVEEHVIERNVEFFHTQEQLLWVTLNGVVNWGTLVTPHWPRLSLMALLNMMPFTMMH